MIDQNKLINNKHHHLASVDQRMKSVSINTYEPFRPPPLKGITCYVVLLVYTLIGI